MFLDTNVVVSAFATRGLCADLFRHIVAEHELLIGEVVLDEMRRVFKRKIRLPEATIDEIEVSMRAYHVERRPRLVPDFELRDPGDRLVVASALAAKADVLVTGDRELLALELGSLTITDPRGFWRLASGRPRSRRE